MKSALSAGRRTRAHRSATRLFETNTAESILRYTSDWPELAFDIFPVLPSEKGFEAYLNEPKQ